MMIDFVNKITFPSRKTFFDLKSYQTIPSVIGENGNIFLETEGIFGNINSIRNSDIIKANYQQSFEVKFNSLSKNFNLINQSKVYDFIKNHDDLINFLDTLNPILRKYFRNADYILKVIPNSENDDSKLGLFIKETPCNQHPDVLVNNLLKFNSEIRPLKRKLNLTNKFFVDVGYL